MRALVDDVDACFREHQLLRTALAELMAEARAYLEPYGSYANPAMAKARAALDRDCVARAFASTHRPKEPPA